VEIGNEFGWDLVGKSDDVSKGVCNSIANPVAHVSLARASVFKGKMALDLCDVDQTGFGGGADGCPEIDVGGGEGACTDVDPATANVGRIRDKGGGACGSGKEI